MQMIGQPYTLMQDFPALLQPGDLHSSQDNNPFLTEINTIYLQITKYVL